MEIIIGATVSLLVQYVKNVLKLNEYGTLAFVLALSLLGAVAYSYFVTIGVWTSFASVLTTAGAFYTFVIQRFHK